MLTRDYYDDGDGRRCLVGAPGYQALHPKRERGVFSAEAMKQGPPHRKGGLVYFNDRCQSFVELRAVIVDAQAIALGETERESCAAAFERCLLAELGPELAARVARRDKRETDI